jgi:hypothetical protein
MSNNWTSSDVAIKLKEISNKGYISIPTDMYRNDDGIVGQLLEREFEVQENNIHLADLGTFELKGMRNRKSKSNLTLFHKKPDSGCSVIEIFDRFGYIKESNRYAGKMKKKLFTTIKGGKANSLGLKLFAQSDSEVMLYHNDEYISTWDLSDLKKIEQVVLAFADTIGTVNTLEEKFHFVKGYLLYNINHFADLINDGIIVIDLCVDQDLDSKKGPHDRGPHMRIPVSKLNKLYRNIEVLL